MKYIYDDGEFILEVRLSSDKLLEKNMDIRLLFLLDGQASIHVCDDIYELKKEDLFVINPGSSCNFLPHGNTLLCSIIISYKTLREYLDPQYVVFCVNSLKGNGEEYTLLREKLKSILHLAIVLTEDKKDVRMTILFNQIMECLICYFLVSDTERRKQNKNTMWKNRTEFYVESNYQRHISLKELSDELFIAYHYLSRSFQDMFGMNFNAYVNNVRLGHVIKDLHYTKKNITEIALDNGFTSSSILNRAFKSIYHMTPNEYKKNVSSNLKKEDPDKSEEVLRSQVEKFLIDNQKENVNISKKNYYSVSANVLNYRRCTKVFNKMINIGFAPDLLFAGLQEHVLILHEELGYSYIRIWNILHKKMDLWDGQNTDDLNFEKTDQLFDFLVKHNLKPFIEFGNKPKIIINTVSMDNLENGGDIEANQFRRIESFRNILKAFIDHVVDRYGVDEVTAWQYELWNEFILPDRAWEEKEVGFFDIFNIFYEVIKTRLPDAIVGGSGMPVGHWLKNFYHEWAKNNKPDFISVMIYPYNVSNKIYETDADYIRKSIDQVHSYLEAAGMKCKLYITEWNSTLSSRDYQNDSCYQAAYCVKNAIDIIEKVDLAGFWVGSDRYTSGRDANAAINGGSGLLTKDGIHKPSFFAFKFLNRLDNLLITSEKHSIITTDLHGEYTILCHNYSNMDFEYYMLPEIQRSLERHVNDQKHKEKLLLEFKLEGFIQGNYKVRVSNMSPSNANILNEWRKMDSETKLNKDEIEYLKNICVPRLSYNTVHVKEDGLFIFSMELEPQEIALLKISI